MAGVAVCRTCNEIVVPTREKHGGKDACPRCHGKLLDRTVAAFEAWESSRLEKKIAAWHRDGVVDDNAREKLLLALGKVVLPKTPQEQADEARENEESEKSKADRLGIEQKADDIFTSTSTFFATMQTNWKGVVARIDEDAPPPPSLNEGEDDDVNRPRRSDESTEAGRAMFAAAGGGAIVGAGIDALSELDDHDAAAARRAMPAQPMGALQIFWFIGAILVLAGSLMGVREAWRSLEGVMRPLVIAGALFAYHVGFVALSRMLARRSETTGRVLGVIAVGLAPIAFIAVSVAAGMSQSVGIASAAVLIAASTVTFLGVGRVYSAGVGLGIAMGLVPCLALEVLLGGEADPRTRLFVPIAGLLPLAFTAARARSRIASPQVIASIAVAAYGAVVVALYALFGGPNQNALNPGTFGAPLLACVAWVGLAATIAWVAATGTSIANQFPRAAPAIRVVMLAVLVGAALTGSASGLSARPQLVTFEALAFAPALVAVLGTIALGIEARRHVLAMHFAIPLAHLAVLLAAFVLTNAGMATWIASMALVPAALLLSSAFVHAKGHRTGIAIWAIASSLIVTFVTLGGESGGPIAADGTSAPLVVTASVAAFLALAAHAGARAVRPGLHYLGVVMAIIAASAWFVPSRPETAWFTIAMILDGVAVVYGVLALGYGLIPNANTATSTLRPLDDASLIAAILCVYFGWVVLGPGPLPSRGLERDAVGALVPTAIAALVLAIRSLRDQSRLVTLHAGLGVGVATQLGALVLASGTPLSAIARTSITATRISNANAMASITNASTANVAAQGAIVAGLTALLLIIPATLRAAPAQDASRYGRPIFGFIPLPLGARGRTVLDGFGLAAIVFAVLGCVRAVQWIGSGVYLSPQRELVLVGLVAIIVTVLVAFTTRGLVFVRARGHLATLIAGGAVVALTAISYRIGRPLPPDVVGFRLTFVLIGVWFLARLVVWKGPWIAEKLDRSSHGTLYHYVVHAGVLALGGLLLVDGLLVGNPTWSRALAVTPPMLMLGGAIAMFLLYRSFGARAFLHAGLASLLFFACFVGAQGHVLGPELVPLDPPGGRWMLISSVPAVRAAEQAQGVSSILSGVRTYLSNAWIDPTTFLPKGVTTLHLADRAIVGTSIFVFACAALLLAITRAPAVKHLIANTLLGHSEDDEDQEHVEWALIAWIGAGAFFAALAIAWQPSVIGAAILLVAGVVAVFARTGRARAIAFVLAAPMVIHALAHADATGEAFASGLSPMMITATTSMTNALVPAWAGPAMALLALAVVLAGASGSKRSPDGRDPTLLIATQAVAALYGCFAIDYAAANKGMMQATAAFWRLTDLALFSTDGRYAQTPALALSLAILAVACAIGAWTWRGAIARVASIVPALFLAGAAFCASASLVYTTANDVLPRTITKNGPLLGAAYAIAALIMHSTGIVLQSRNREDAAWGSRIGRDFNLLAAAGTMAIFVTNAESGGLDPATFGMLALGLPIAIAIHAITREGSTRHVYFVEVMVVALYAFATRAMNLRPEIDAMLGLGYGFTLLGIAVIARRQGLVPVADATRRFLAALPLLVAFLTMRGPITNIAAIFAIGTSVLYGVVAMTEHSRTFGSLAAVAANIAVVVFALSQGLDGIEIWLGPLGLLVAAISQIFAPKLSAGARSAIRITGGALLYLPSGLKLALRLGAAEDATYSIVFGAVCLLGVVAGVVLKVRAYLALATLSLTLDVIANLVYAGLRDHRLGFVILSTSGLLILGVMIMVTMRRDRARALMGTMRSQLSGWD